LSDTSQQGGTGNTASETITVVVADDHPGYLDALAYAIRNRPGLELAGTAAQGDDALALLRELQPTAAIIDQHLPTLAGVDVVAAAQQDGLPTRIVILSGDGSGPLAFEAMNAGAGGVITKTATLPAILDVLVAVAQGGTVIGADFQAGLAEELRARCQPDGPLLTGREIEVLRLVAAGESAPEIARIVLVSPSTVRTHIKNVFEKLGVSDRAAAVAEGMRRGLLE
jgi:two-component system, NarL family, nitrate/nitrite response regulator NarL